MKRFLAMIISSVCIATIGVFVKLIGDSVPIMTVSFFRFFFGFLFIAVCIPFIDRNFMKVKLREMLEYALLGAFIAFDFSMYTAAFTMAPISSVVLLSSFYPVIVAVLSYFFLREKTEKAAIISFVIAFAGLLMINPLHPDYMAGNLLALANSFVYAILVVLMRYINKKKSIGVVFWFLMFATLFTSPLPFIYGFGNMQSSFVWIFLLGVISTGLAYILFNFTLEKMPAEISSVIMLTTEPVVSIVLGVIVIGESVALATIIGGLLIIMGGIILEVRGKVSKKY